MSKELGKKINPANGMTFFRLIGGAALAFIEPLSMPFYIVYSLCGLSDVLDGTVARYTHTASEFGAKLDSVADLVFYTVLLIRVLPAMVAALPGWIWYWVAGILVLRVIGYGMAAVKFHRFLSRHTWLNKLTGFMLFMVPYALSQPFFTSYGICVCVEATLAVAEEIAMHFICRDCDSRCKSIFSALRQR